MAMYDPVLAGSPQFQGHSDVRYDRGLSVADFAYDYAAADPVKPPGLLVIMYPEIGDPPSLVGAVHVTVAVWLFGTMLATPMVGAVGTLAAVVLP